MKRITIVYSIFLLYLTACMASSASNPSTPTTSLPDLGFSSTTIRYSTTSSTTSSSSTTYEITTPKEEYITTLTSISTELVTTTTLYCPSEENVCYVERDMTGDNEFECCNEENNMVCETCLPACKSMCQQRGEGVEYCFGGNMTFGCECTKRLKPTCYQTTTTTTTHVSTTYAGIVDATKANSPVYYIILIIVTLAVFVGAIYYLRKI